MITLSELRTARKPQHLQCFAHIRDFRKHDSIIVMMSGNRRVRGVVVSVDDASNLITFNSKEGEYVTDINAIVFLDDYRREWLERGTA